MDFSLDESQQAVAELADQILESRVSPEGIKEMEDAGDWFDRDTYAELAKAGLCGIGLREDIGGGGMGILETAQVMEAMGPTCDTAAALELLGSSHVHRSLRHR